MSPESLDERALAEAAKALWYANLQRQPPTAFPCDRLQEVTTDDLKHCAAETVTGYLAALSEQGPPLDEWLKSAEALKIVTKAIKDFMQKPGAAYREEDLARALLEALAEHRKANQ